VNDPDSRSTVVFQGCESAAEPPGSLFAKHRQAEGALRRTLIGNRSTRKGQFFDFIWLVYSFFFIIDPIQEHSRRLWILFGTAYAVFLGLYFGMVFARQQRTKFLLLFGLLVLGVAYYPFNAGAAGMFIYASAFIPFITENIWLSGAVIAAATVLTAGEGWLKGFTPWNWGIMAFFCITVGAANAVASQKMRAGMRLGLAHEEIAHLAKVAERERIARDLHDVLGHTLSVVVLKSELAGKLMDRDPDRARREIGEVEQIARKALGDVREAISGYRAGGLAAEIARAQTTLDAAGVTLECESKPPPLPPAEETVLSLIVREAVTNIVRHAQASRCVLEIKSGDDGTALVVQDDGRGGVRQEGNGLRGMRERAVSIGGTFQIDSAQGTRLVIQIPSRAIAESQVPVLPVPADSASQS
jgi:two-component system, NarL family, sensor histidine kinase DesK